MRQINFIVRPEKLAQWEANLRACKTWLEIDNTMKSALLRTTPEEWAALRSFATSLQDALPEEKKDAVVKDKALSAKWLRT